MSHSRYAEGESGNGEVNGMATNHLQGRSSRIVSRGWEAEGAERGSLSDTNFFPTDGNTQKLAAFVVFGILTGRGLVYNKYFHIFPGAPS